MAVRAPRRSPRRTPSGQRYSMAQRVVAALINRRPFYISAGIALGVLILILGFNAVYVSLHHPDYSPAQILLNALTFLALNNLDAARNDPFGSFLIVFNILFTILFAQSLLDSARTLISPLPLRDRQQGLAATLTRHTIVCGLGRVGFRVASRLVAAGDPIVVIERDWQAKFVDRAVALGIPVVIGDAREATILRRAGIERAKSILAIIDGDLVDLEIVLAAKQLHPGITFLLRAFNESFDSGVESRFGSNTAFSVSALAAPTFTVATVARDIIGVLVLGASGDEIAGILRVAIAPDHPRVATLDTLEQQHRVRILHREAPEGTIVLGIIGSLPQLEGVRQALRTGVAPARPSLLPTADRNRIIVCGLGKIGYRLVNRLRQMQTGAQIVVVQRPEDAQTPFTNAISGLEGIQMITGDAGDITVLRQAGLDQALTIAAVTSNDELNVRVGLEARRVRPDIHVVMRVFSEELAEEMGELFGIHTTYSVSNLASPTLAAAALIPGVQQGFAIEQRLFAARLGRIHADSPLVGQKVGALCESQAITIASIRRASALDVIPPDDRLLRADDIVAFVAELPNMRAFIQRFGAGIADVAEL